MKNVDVRFHEINESTINISTDSRLYKLRQDSRIGDWKVVCESDSQVQGNWIMTKGGAIQYVLYQAGVIENANYRRAPDRTSA